jgi:PAS domain S-box-containing protein
MAPDGPGNPALSVVLVEDDPADRELIVRSLRDLSVAHDIRHVQDEPSLKRELVSNPPDIVLSDFSLPGFSGPRALQMLRAIAPDVPFILVSGTIGEEQAIGALQLGAVDYILKNNLQRLPSAVEAAVAAAARQREHRQATHALRESDERFRAVVQASGAWIWECDAQLRLTYSNGQVRELLGVDIQEIVGAPLQSWVHPEDWPALRDNVASAFDARSGWRELRLRVTRSDGTQRWIETSALPRQDARGGIDGFRAVSRDIGLRIEREETLNQLARFHAVLVELSNAILRATDLQSLLDYTCELAVEHGGFNTAIVFAPDAGGESRLRAAAGDARLIEWATARSARALAAGEDERPSLRVMRTGKSETGFDTIYRGDSAAAGADLRSLGVSAQLNLPIGSPPWAVLALASSGAQAFGTEELALLERLAAEIDYARGALAKSERLEWLAHHDPASGLPNRAAILAHARTLGGGPWLVAAVHVADYRALHDVRGRAFADDVVAAIGHRLCEALGPMAHVAHLGGEYFVVAGAAPDAAAATRALEDSLAKCAATPVSVREEAIHFALRGGVALAPDHGDDLDTLERHALSALVEVERTDQLLFAFNDELRARVERRRLLERELRVAVAEEQFEVYLQPKLNAADSRLYGAEALMRWRHPTLGMVSPAEFVPLLESTGLIVTTGQWVMQSAYRLLRRWRDQGLGEHRLCVNVSAREFRQKGFVERCEAIFDGDSDGVDIEVTESVVMHDLQRTIEILNGLRALGCTVSIDDFGTGYSSLNYLAKLPTDILKIDRSFIADMAVSAETLSLVTNIIALAHSLDLKVVAEGVETEEQAKLLRLLRCDMLQGYLLGRPVPVEEFERAWLR